MDIMKQTSLKTFRGTPYRSTFTVDENVQTMYTTEYHFLSQDTIQQTVGLWGNGVQYATTLALYAYRQEEFAEQNVGQYYILKSIETGEEKRIKFENNAIHDGDNVCDLTFSTINSIATIDADFSNTNWAIDTTVFWTKDVEKILSYDTIKHIEKDPQTGQKHWVIDTVLPHKGMVKDTLGPKFVVSGTFSFLRDNEYKNTGKITYDYLAFEKGNYEEPMEEIHYDGGMNEYLPLYHFTTTRDKGTGEVTDKTIMCNEFPLTWIKD